MGKFNLYMKARLDSSTKRFIDLPPQCSLASSKVQLVHQLFFVCSQMYMDSVVASNVSVSLLWGFTVASWHFGELNKVRPYP